MSALAKQPSSPNMVLAQALLNTGKEFGLNQEQLAAVIGVHRADIYQRILLYFTFNKKFDFKIFM